jgi:hypothetical protein
MPDRESQLPQPGDVFASRVDGRRYGGVRVLQVDDQSALVAVSPWLGEHPPDLSEPALRETLVQNRFFYRGELALGWLEGALSSGLILVGNLPPSEAELALESSTYQGDWHDQVARPALLEWRWSHDREALVAEVKSGSQPSKPAPERAMVHPMLRAADFWELIKQIDLRGRAGDHEAAEPLITALARRPVNDILGFEERLADYLFQLDGEKHAREIGEHSFGGPEKHFSADLFLYARCYVVSRGRAFYERVRRDPSFMPKDSEFEDLLQVAPSAFKRATKSSWRHIASRNYETFSNTALWSRSRP